MSDDFKKYPLGVVPSPKDTRDYKVSYFYEALNNFPEEYIIPNDVKKVYDQGAVGSCVAFSLKYIKECQEFKERSEVLEFSPGFIYLNRHKRPDGSGYEHEGQNEGMLPKDALKSLQLDGVCEYKYFPYNVPYSEASKYPIPQEAFANAIPQKIKYYYAVSTVNEIKTALMNSGAVLYCIPVYESFYNVNKDGIVPMPYGQLYGYHAMVIIGWRKDNKWIVKNSWGENWGDHGLCYIDFNHPMLEAWGITDDNIRENKIEIWINKKDVAINGILISNKLDQPPIIDSKTNRTLVPIRFIAETLGCTVEYEDKTRKITIRQCVK